MAKAENIKAFNRVAQNVKRIRENAKRDKKVTFAIVFNAPHAVHVHENLEMPHPNGGQAKYLEQPLRERASEISNMIKTLMKQGRTLRQAILITANWFLQNYVKPLVPVDTGELVSSGQVKVV